MADRRFFKNCGPLTLKELAKLGQAEVFQPSTQGVDLSTPFVDVAPMHEAQANHVTVLHNPKYQDQLAHSRAGVCIVDPQHSTLVPSSAVALISKTPYRSYALIAAAFYPNAFDMQCGQIQGPAISPSAKIGTGCLLEPGVVIGELAEIGTGVAIAANTVIGPGVVIGDNCKIGANVTLTHSLIGRGVVIYPGARIGQAGFGFYMDEAGHIQVPQLGRVIVEDGVEIGSNTTIDRGSGADTIIGAGCRLDNLIQIAHNVQLGKGCVIVAQVGIAGSTKIGDFSVIAGQVGIAGHLTIGKGVKVAAQSGVMRDIPDGGIVGGSPAVSAQLWHRQIISLQRLAKNKLQKVQTTPPNSVNEKELA